MLESPPSIDQQPIEAVSRSTWDVIVVGAGPAGGIAAHVLAGRGMRVLLVDRAQFPREKACGDALAPEAVQVLQKVNLAQSIQPWAFATPGYTMVSPAGSSADIACPMTLIRRRILDALVAGSAVANGAVFARAHLDKAALRNDGVECAFGRSLHQCQALIVATGASHEILRSLGLAENAQPDGIALRRYYRSSVGPERPCFFFRKEFLPGYAWIFPLGGQEYNVGCGRFSCPSKAGKAPLHRLFESFLQEEPMAQRLVCNSTSVSPVRGAILRCGVRGRPPPCCGRVLLVGEIIGTTVPGWGEGISLAMRTGLLAAEAVLAAEQEHDLGQLAEYARGVRQKIKPVTRRNQLFTLLFAQVWATNLFVALARRSSLVRRLVAKQKPSSE